MKLKDHNNPKYTEISLYVIVTVAVIYILSKLADHAGLIIRSAGNVLHHLGTILTPLIIGFVIAYLLWPIVAFIRSKLATIPFIKKRGINPKGTAVALTLLLALAILIGGGSVVVFAVTHEISVVSFDSLTDTITAIGNSMQNVYADLQSLLNRMNISSEQLRRVVETATKWFGSLSSRLGASFLNSVSNLTGIMTNAVFALILSIYFLLDAQNLMAYWDRVFRALAPHRMYRAVHTAIRDADTVFSGYIRGQLIDAILMAVMISAALSIVGVKFAIIIGIFAGIGNLIPYVGPIIAYGLTAVVCLLGGDLKKLLIAVILLFVIQTLDGNVINPKLLSSNTNVHPMLVIVALLFGSSVGGVGGMLLAVPVAALLNLWFDRLIDCLMQRRHQTT